MRSVNLQILSVLIIFSMTLPTTGWSAPILFDNQTTFNIAVANAGITLTTDGFEDLPAPAGISSPLSRTGYTVTEVNGGIFGSPPPGPSIIDGTRSLTTIGSQDPVIFNFATPINVFSIQLADLDFNLAGGSLGLTIDGVPQPLGVHFGDDVSLFLGVLDTATPFASVSIDRTTNDVYSFDLVRFGETSMAPVPEPSTLLLFGSGLASLVGWRFRNRRKN